MSLPNLRFPEFQNSWKIEKLGELGKFLGGGTPDKSVSEYWQGGIPWISSSDINDDDIHTISVTRFINEKSISGSATKIIPKGSVLFVSRVGTGKLAINNEDLCTSQDFTSFIPEKIYSYFLGYFFIANRSVLTSLDQGTSIKGFSKSDLAKFKLSFPQRAEQQKIVDCLSSLDELITAQTQKLDTLKTHKKGLMQQLFPAEGDTVPKLRFPEFQDAGDWKEYTLIQVAKFRRGSFPQPYGLPEWYDEVNGTPFIQVFDVSDNLRLKSKTKNKISKLAAQQSVFIPKDTLIVTIQGSIGRVAITQYDAYIDRTLLLFEKFLKPIEKLFFAYIIQNLFEIEKEKAPGGIIKTITKEALSDFKIMLPTFTEQKKIADCLFSVDELIAAQAQKIEALKQHKKGLMQQLFPAAEEVAG